MLCLTCLSKADDTTEAIKATQKALYKQFKIDEIVKKAKNKYIPKSVQKVGGWIIIGYDAAQKEEIKYTWEYKF